MPRNPALSAPEFPPPPIAADLVDLAETLTRADLPVPRVSASWYRCDDDTIRSIIAAFPDLKWVARSGGTTEWVEGVKDGVSYIAYAASNAPNVATPRLTALLPDLDAAMKAACADEVGA